MKWKFWQKSDPKPSFDDLFYEDDFKKPSLKHLASDTDHIKFNMAVSFKEKYATFDTYDSKYVYEFKTASNLAAKALEQQTIDKQFADLSVYFSQQAATYSLITQVWSEMDPWCLVLEGVFKESHIHAQGDYLYDLEFGEIFGKFISISEKGYFKFRTSTYWLDSHRHVFNTPQYFKKAPSKVHRDAESELWDD